VKLPEHVFLLALEAGEPLSLESALFELLVELVDLLPHVLPDDLLLDLERHVLNSYH
jgi:hypothetical protein